MKVKSFLKILCDGILGYNNQSLFFKKVLYLSLQQKNLNMAVQ